MPVTDLFDQLIEECSGDAHPQLDCSSFFCTQKTQSRTTVAIGVEAEIDAT